MFGPSRPNPNVEESQFGQNVVLSEPVP